MKYIYTLLFTLSLYSIASAQQVDNALLLDYYQTQKYNDAYAYLKTVYHEPITDVKQLNNLAYTAKMSGNLTDAEIYYLRLYDKDSTDIKILFNLGGINISRRNNQKALIYYKKILLRDSTNFSVYKQLAELSVGDSLNYITYLKKANAINPIDADVAYDLGLDYIILGKFPNASIVINKALKADTANLMLLRGKAQVSYMLKDYPATIITCKKLIDAGERAGGVTNWLAVSYYQTRQYKLCIATYQTLSVDMQNEGSYFYTAMSYKGLNDQPNSIAYFLKALKAAISPNVPDYYYDLGDAYDNLHDLKKSLASYQKSLQFEERPLTYYSLANVYDTELKDKKSALKYFKKYLAAKPDPKQEQKYIDYANLRIPALEAK